MRSAGSIRGGIVGLGNRGELPLRWIIAREIGVDQAKKFIPPPAGGWMREGGLKIKRATG